MSVTMERSKMMMAMKRIVQLVTEVETENVQNAMAEDHGTVMSVVMDMLSAQIATNKTHLTLFKIFISNFN